jgi:hypothetical protein
MTNVVPPEIRAIDDERLMWIGWVCKQWSSLEYLVFRYIGKMLAMDEETAKVVIGGTDLRPRLAMASEIAKLQRRPAVRKALTEAAQALDGGILKRRNRAIHGVQFLYDTGELQVEVHRGKDRARRPLSKEDLEALSSDIWHVAENLNVRVAPLLWKRKPPPFALLERPAPRSRKKKAPKRGQTRKRP